MQIIAHPANPKGAMIRSAVWALTSIVFVVTTRSQIERVRHAGAHVPMIQSAMLCFWLVMVTLCLYQAWKNRQRLRTDKKVL